MTFIEIVTFLPLNIYLQKSVEMCLSNYSDVLKDSIRFVFVLLYCFAF